MTLFESFDLEWPQLYGTLESQAFIRAIIWIFLPSKIDPYWPTWPHVTSNLFFLDIFWAKNRNSCSIMRFWINKKCIRSHTVIWGHMGQILTIIKSNQMIAQMKSLAASFKKTQTWVQLRSFEVKNKKMSNYVIKPSKFAFEDKNFCHFSINLPYSMITTVLK